MVDWKAVRNSVTGAIIAAILIFVGSSFWNAVSDGGVIRFFGGVTADDVSKIVAEEFAKRPSPIPGPSDTADEPLRMALVNGSNSAVVPIPQVNLSNLFEDCPAGQYAAGIAVTYSGNSSFLNTVTLRCRRLGLP